MPEIPHFTAPFDFPSVRRFNPVVGDGPPGDDAVPAGSYYYDQVAKVLWGPKPPYGWSVSHNFAPHPRWSADLDPLDLPYAVTGGAAVSHA